MGARLEKTWLPADGSGLSRRAKAGGKYRAYLPDPLSEGISISPEIAARAGILERQLLSLTRKDTAFGLEGISRFLLRSEAISSSRIEGIAPAADKVALAELADSESITGFNRSAELVANNIAILKMVESRIATADAITPNDFCELQSRLIETPKIAGLRTEQNWIGGSNWNPLEAEFVPPPPEYVAGLIDDLCIYLSGAEHGALIQAAIVHAQFETIHPFADGNGRVGRALIHAVLQRRGLTNSPMLPVSMILGTWPNRYVAGLTAFRESNIDAWLDFFFTATEEAIKQCARISEDIAELTAEWQRRFVEHHTNSGAKRAPRSDSAGARILTQLAEYPVLTANSAARIFDLSDTAARRALESLADAGILRRKSVHKSGTTGYLADEILDLITFAERRLASTQFDTRVSPPRGGFPKSSVRMGRSKP